MGATELCRALAPNAATPEPARMLALLLAEAGHGDEARRWAERALALDDGDAHSHAALGRVLLRAGALAAAEPAFRAALALDPQLGSAGAGLRAIAATEQRRGRALFAGRRWSEAATAFALAARCGPDDAAAWHDLGAALHEAGRLAEARDAYRRSLARSPERADTWHNLGGVSQALGDWGGAMAAYGQAYVCQPTSFARIAQELAAGNPGRVWLDAGELRRTLRRAAEDAPSRHAAAPKYGAP